MDEECSNTELAVSSSDDDDDDDDYIEINPLTDVVQQGTTSL